jgi:vesicle coat complex subunit
MLIPKEESLVVKHEALFADEEASSADIFGSQEYDKKESDFDGIKNEDSNSCSAFVKPEFKAEVHFDRELWL